MESNNFHIFKKLRNFFVGMEKLSLHVMIKVLNGPIIMNLSMENILSNYFSTLIYIKINLAGIQKISFLMMLDLLLYQHLMIFGILIYPETIFYYIHLTIPQSLL